MIDKKNEIHKQIDKLKSDMDKLESDKNSLNEESTRISTQIEQSIPVKTNELLRSSELSELEEIFGVSKVEYSAVLTTDGKIVEGVGPIYETIKLENDPDTIDEAIEKWKTWEKIPDDLNNFILLIPKKIQDYRTVIHMKEILKELSDHLKKIAKNIKTIYDYIRDEKIKRAWKGLNERLVMLKTDFDKNNEDYKAIKIDLYHYNESNVYEKEKIDGKVATYIIWSRTGTASYPKPIEKGFGKRTPIVVPYRVSYSGSYMLDKL